MSLEICQTVKGLNFPVCTESDLVHNSLEIVSKTSNIGLWAITSVAVGVAQLSCFSATCYHLSADKKVDSNCAFLCSWLMGTVSSLMLLHNTFR